MSTLITGIGELTTNDGPALSDAALVLDGDTVAWVGPAAQAPAADTAVDVAGRAVLPGWVDSHTHLVFAGDRTEEFAARMAGQPYTAGGIAVTVNATRAASDDELAAVLRKHVAEAVAQGTTCLETKTGYGLTVADELRSARLAAAHADEVTFLGAHLVPAEMSTEDYVDLVCGEMLDAVAPHVRWADVFCETGAFDEDQSRAVLTAARARGLGLRVHGNQLGYGPGVRLAVELGAASVDHCTYLSPSDVDALAQSSTVATLLPACDLSTRQPLPDARELLDSGATVALASNCNPGSSYTSSMAYCVATAVLQMRMSVEEAVRAATLGGARALRRDDVGVLRPGARADVHVLDAPSVTHLAYRPGVPLTYAVWRAGALQRKPHDQRDHHDADGQADPDQAAEL
jgi:imidazolonepropionase